VSRHSAFVLGMFASIAIAIAGDAKNCDPPWDRILSLGGLAGTAITGYLAQPKRQLWTEDRRQDQREQDDLDRLADDTE
jgi:hypothetical protein